MLDYMTCEQVSADPEDPTNYYNDANYCDEEYDRLYEQQKVELDRDKREEIVHEMLTRWQQSAVYNVIWAEPDTHRLRARTASRAGSQQPEETGPVLYSNTSPTYARLEAGDRGGRRRPMTDGGGSGGIIAILVGRRAGRSARRWWW